jgi:hypothetical protein
LFFFRSGSSKLDEAAELFQKAGNLFKIAKNWTSNIHLASDLKIINLD